MTPAERQLVSDLFDRLSALEDAPRDPEAERAIRDGQSQAPNALYALVQTALVQDEALKRADARIKELEAQLGPKEEPARPGSFLDSMRDSILGRRDEGRGSVPQVRPGATPMGAPAGFGGGGSGQPMGGQPMGGGYPPAAQPGYPEPRRGFGGGSFLGTAAAAAAGAVGGSLLLDSIRGMMGSRSGGHALADSMGLGGSGSSPWGSAGGTGSPGNAGSDDLARQLGGDDIGRGYGSEAAGYSDTGHGLFGERMADSDALGSMDQIADDDSDLDLDGSDFGGDFGGDD